VADIKWINELLNKRNGRELEVAARAKLLPEFWATLGVVIEEFVTAYRQRSHGAEVTFNPEENSIQVRQTRPVTANVLIEKQQLQIIAHYDSGEPKIFEVKPTTSPEKTAKEILKPVLFPDEDGRAVHIAVI
jgi:hypothetical protein